MELVTVILDTCSLLWWWSDPTHLSDRVRAIVEEPETSVYVSPASAWEIATKYRIKKLPAGDRVMREWEHRIGTDRFTELSITAAHAFRAGTLLGSHRDPFDRMIAAQSILERLPVVTPDARIESLGAERVW